MIKTFYYKSLIGILKIELENDIVLGLKVVEGCENLSKRVGYFAEVGRLGETQQIKFFHNSQK